MSIDPHLRISLPSDGLAKYVDDIDDLEVIIWDLEGASPADSFDIVVPPYLRPVEQLAALKELRIRLIQSQMIGFDGVRPFLPAGSLYANAASVHETATAELTLALILASQRGLGDFVQRAQAGEWKPDWRPGLADARVLLIGYGGVGRAICDRLEPFEVEVVRVASTARSDERGLLHGVNELPELVGKFDVVIVAVPLLESTRGMVDDDFLSRMREGSLLVNMARGPVVDTAALVRHVSSGRIRAALDVVDPEPLPAGHPLYGLPGVLLTPHVGGRTNAMQPRMGKLLRHQIECLRTGKDPINLILAGQA
jgi:phosphoglycerate dehydrogenase-like enzyme